MGSTAGIPEELARQLAADPMVVSQAIDEFTPHDVVAPHAPRPSIVFVRQLALGQEYVAGILVLPESSRGKVAFLPDAEYDALAAAPAAPERAAAERKSDRWMLKAAFGLVGGILALGLLVGLIAR